MKKVTQFSKDKSGTAAIEYALLAALIALLAIDAFNAVGSGLTNIYNTVAMILNGSYDLTITNGTEIENGVAETYQTISHANPDGSVTSSETAWNTSTGQETWSSSDTYSCNNGICSSSGTSYTPGVGTNTFSSTMNLNTGVGQTTYTNSQGQTETINSTTSGNNVNYSGTNFAGNAVSWSDTKTGSSTSIDEF